MSLNKISPSNLISSEEEELKKSLENIEDRETLKKGYYLGVLENYRKRPPWTMQAISRDGWQNFFDVKHTLDGIEFELKEEENKGSILIKCDFKDEKASYDYTELLSFGGGYKGDTEEEKETAAGGKHEGTRIIALNMLRDYEFTKIVYGSKDWELEFYFNEPPKIVTGKRQKGLKGLYAKLKNKKEEPGSYAFFETKNKELLENFVKARDYFYHSEHKDFKNFDVVNERGAFKFLGMNEKGHIYYNGQRIKYNQKGDLDETDTPHFIFWSKKTPRWQNKEINLGDDRSLITYHDMAGIFLPFFTKGMTKEDLVKTLEILKPFYKKEGVSYDLEKPFLKCVTERLKESGFKYNFPSGMLASDISDDTKKTLESMGYTLCEEFLADIGMPSASAIYEEIKEINAVEPTPEELQKIELIKSFIKDFLKKTEKDKDKVARELKNAGLINESVTMEGIEAKDIKLFSTNNPLEGRYNEKFVYLKKDLLRDEHPDRTLIVYKHEICHKQGTDESAAFSYAQDALSLRWTKYLRENPAALTQLNEEWQKIKIIDEWKNFSDFENVIINLEKYIEKNEDDPYIKDYEKTEKTAISISDIIEKVFKKKDYEINLFKRIYLDILVHPNLKKSKEAYKKIISYYYYTKDDLEKIEKKEEYTELNKNVEKLNSKINEFKKRIAELNSEIKNINKNRLEISNESVKIKLKKEMEKKQKEADFLQSQSEIKEKELKEIQKSPLWQKQEKEKTEILEKIKIQTINDKQLLESIKLLDKSEIYTFLCYNEKIDLNISINNYFGSILNLYFEKYIDKKINLEKFDKDINDLIIFLNEQPCIQEEKKDLRLVLTIEINKIYEHLKNKLSKNRGADIAYDLKYAEILYNKLNLV